MPIGNANGRHGPRLVAEQHGLADTYLVLVRGEIDLGTAPLFRGALQEAVEAPQRKVVVDLAGVEFMDSTALHLLLNTLRRLKRQRRELEIVCSEGAVRRVFESTGLVETFRIRPNRALALPTG